MNKANKEIPNRSEYTTRKTPVGNKTIVNEKCRCGALRTQHGSRLEGLAQGHGPCPETGCERFTWQEFVFLTPVRGGKKGK